MKSDNMKGDNKMAFRSNPYLEDIEKKHPKLFFAIRFIVSALVFAIGLWLLFSHKEPIQDISVPITMIVSGSLGLIFSLVLKLKKP